MSEKHMKLLITVLICLIALGVLAIVVLLVIRNVKNNYTAVSKNKTIYAYSNSKVYDYIDYLYTDDDAYEILVNKSNPIDKDYKPASISLTSDVSDCVLSADKAYEIETRTLYALTAMLLEAKEAGIDSIRVTSAYRTYEYQEWLFEHYINEEMNANASLTRADAEKIVSKYSNPKGTSEHQTGLAVDLYDENDITTRLKTSFDTTKAGKWLAENCYKFGFILRFPNDKTEITGNSYESWHFRYVGIENAARIYKEGLCLEEFVSKK